MKQHFFFLFLLVGFPVGGSVRAQEGSSQDTAGVRIPRLLWPADMSRGVGARPMFLWSPHDSTSRYGVLLSTDSLFSSPVYADSTIRDTTARLPFPLLNDTTYYWQVSVLDSSGRRETSAPFRFSTGPQPVCSPRWLKFPYTRRGDAAFATLLVRNPADRPCDIDTVVSGSGSFGIIDSLPARLEAGDSLLLQVRFTPYAPAYYSEYLRLVTDLGDPSVFVTGDSPPALLSTSPDLLRFGPLVSGDSLSLTVTVGNQGRFNDLLLTRFSISGSAFRLARPIPRIIPPGERVQVQVYFHPPRGSHGWFSDTLRIESDGGESAIPLTGECPYPDARFSEKGVAFADVRYTDSATTTLQITNRSINDLRIDSLFLPSGAFRAWLPARTIPPGDSLKIPIRFIPWRLGTFADTLNIFTNARVRRIRVPIRAASPYPSIGTTVHRLDFGESLRGERAVREIGIYNSSVNPLSLDSLVLRNTAFRVERLSVSDVVRRGDTLRFVLHFMPVAGGQYRDTLLIASNAGIRQWRVPLTGVGIMPDSSAAGPDEFALFPNYPNPFRGMTTFRFALPERCYIRLAVYNSLGQELAVVKDGEAEAGYHNVRWNSDVASGVYFCKLVAVPVKFPDRQYVGSRRLMVLR